MIPHDLSVIRRGVYYVDSTENGYIVVARDTKPLGEGAYLAAVRVTLGLLTLDRHWLGEVVPKKKAIPVVTGPDEPGIPSTRRVGYVENAIPVVVGAAALRLVPTLRLVEEGLIAAARRIHVPGLRASLLVLFWKRRINLARKERDRLDSLNLARSSTLIALARIMTGPFTMEAYATAGTIVWNENRGIFEAEKAAASIGSTRSGKGTKHDLSFQKIPEAVAPNNEVAFDEICGSFRGMAWRDRNWLRILAHATWRQAQILKRYTVPAGAIFPLAEDFAHRTGVASLRFVSESKSRVEARFDLRDGRFSLLTLTRNAPLPMGQWPLQDVLVAVAVAIYRDCVVADSLHARIGFRVSPRLGSSLPAPKARPYEVPRTYQYQRSTPSTDLAFGDSRPPHPVVGHVRRLQASHSASPEQIEIAVSYGVPLSPSETFVRPYFTGESDKGEAREREARARRMAPALADSLHFAVSWT